MNLIRLKQMALIAVLSLFAIVASAQNQSITLDLKNVPLRTVLENVEKQIGKSFFYEDNLIDLNKNVTIAVNNADLKTVIDRLFDKTITYSQTDQHVVLQKVRTGASGIAAGTPVPPPGGNPSSWSSPKGTTASSPARSVRGTVYDQDGQPLPGALVAVKGDGRRYALANAAGQFELGSAKEDDVLLISCLGYEALEEPVGARSDISINLKQAVNVLQDVVVTGYQTLSKERTTGSFAVISNEKLATKLQPSLMSVLEGQSAGMVLTKDGKIEIRGVSTINGVNEPLIVLDGYPLIGNGMNLDFVNPDNVESITVLKDAVATSIYGARASNGVIVITTKNAPANRPLNVRYRGTYGVTLKPDLDKLNLASTKDYMEAEADLFDLNPNSVINLYNAYRKMSDQQYYLMLKHQGAMPAAEADARIAALANNNALKEMEKYLLNAKQIQTHNLSISGGTAENKFNAAARYMKETGFVETQKNTRLTFDISDEWTPKKWLTFRIFSNMNYTTSNEPVDTYRTLTSFNPSIDPTVNIFPYSRLCNDNGEKNYWNATPQRNHSAYETTPGMRSVLYNPIDDISLRSTVGNNLQVRMGGDITLKFFDFLQGSVGGAWTKGASTNRTIWDATSFNMRQAYNDGTSRANPNKHYIPEGGRIDEDRGTIETWVIRTQLNYNQSFNNNLHRVTAMLGSEVSRDTYETSYLPTRLGYNPVSATYNSGFNPYEYKNNTGSIHSDMLHGREPSSLYGYTITYGDNYAVRDNRFVSWYGNASYEYNSKYVLTGSVRMDLTNFFGTDPAFRYKPTWSVGGKYKMAEESYFSGLKDLINRLDVRASYGVTGNISLNYTPYLIVAVGSHNEIAGGTSNSINSYPNNSLRWEKTRTLDVGFDMAMLNNRVNITADYYHKYSSDLIVSESIDATKGVATTPQNVGAVTNQGVEITINGTIIDRDDFSWSSTLAAGYNESKVNHYNVNRTTATSYATATGLLVEGYPMDGFWGFRFAGLSDQGTVLYYDKDGNKIDNAALTVDDCVYLGTLRPKLDLSWTHAFRYKNWEASFMFIAKFGAKYRKDAFFGTNYTNKYVGERWRKPGDENTTIYPKLQEWSMDEYYFPFCDVFIGSANYLKLRDVTLAYNFPKTWISRVGLSDAKVFFQTRNLFYITSKGVDIDPETAQEVNIDPSGYMINQGFTSLQLRPEFHLGLQINF